MSKKFSAIAKMLAPAPEVLFDRYINVTFRQNNWSSSEEDFKIKTPITGMKPDVTVSLGASAEDIVYTVTVTIRNINADFDYNMYGYAEVEMGYLSSGYNFTFHGQIINCYMAKPNPNGELILTLASADASMMLAEGNFEVNFENKTKVTVEDFFKTCVKSFDSSVQTEVSLPPEWKSVNLDINGACYYFNSFMDCTAWMNSVFVGYVRNTAFDKSSKIALSSALNAVQLPIIAVTIDAFGQKIMLKPIVATDTKPTLVTLTNIGSAYYMGASAATVTCPFNPAVRPGATVYIDTKYFKTRVSTTLDTKFKKAMENQSSLWTVNTMNVTFSTYTTNTMTLQLSNISQLDFNGR